VSGRLIAGLASALLVVTGASFGLQAHDRRAAGAGDPPHATRPRYAMTRLVTPTPDRAAGSTDRVDPAWLRRTGARTGLQVAALRAYAQAELRLDDGPARGCRIGWPTLAGIGWVESQHGTLGGRTLREDGRSSSPVLGPALDGTGSFAAVRATPGAQAWHGDDEWEHAVGPMQFLPGTWRSWAADGDRDGRADPLDLDDAAAGSARFLCAGGRDLGTVRGWEAGVLSYNRSRAYVDEVYAAATTYAAAAGS
jgi:membrane-bound lytic murein transglycosylase B